MDSVNVLSPDLDYALISGGGDVITEIPDSLMQPFTCYNLLRHFLFYIYIFQSVKLVNRDRWN